MKVLQRLRRRKQAVMSAVLPLLATVWLSAACPGMAAERFGEAPTTSSQSAGDHGVGHDHGLQEAAEHTRAAGEGSSHAHGGCPHCPASTGSSAKLDGTSHVFCEVLDDVSDDAAHLPTLKFELLPVALLCTPTALAPPALQLSSVRSPAYTVNDHRSVALNLRHCVFLI